jgi:tetratricopeptide (TPR) repeat protein
MRWVRTLVYGLSALLVFVVTVQAQSPAQQRAHARELYTNGQQLFRQGDFGGAQRAFEEAYRAVPNPVVLLSIAECYVRMEQYQKAIDTFRSYLSERSNAPDRPQVEAQIQALEKKPATLTVQSNVGGSTIAVDGRDSGHVTPAELSLAAGSHSVAITHDGYVPAEQTVTLTPGSRDTLRIMLTAEQLPAVSEAPTPEPAPVASSDRHGTPAVWTAMAFTGAGVVVGSVLGGLALKKKHEFDKAPTKQLADKGERLALFADVGFGIAIAGGVTALVLYLTSGKKAEPAADQPAQAWSVTPTLARGNYGLAGELQF